MSEDILDWSHETWAIPEAGLSLTREASQEVRAALVKALAIDACDRLVARYTLKSFESGRYTLRGTVEMSVRQTCVVTLDPIERTYRVDLDVDFWPPELIGDGPGTDIDPLSDDPEPIEDGRIAVGRIVYEELASAVDPFPRRDDARFDWSDRGTPVPDNPFAALEKLKWRDA